MRAASKQIGRAKTRYHKTNKQTKSLGTAMYDQERSPKYGIFFLRNKGSVLYQTPQLLNLAQER